MGYFFLKYLKKSGSLFLICMYYEPYWIFVLYPAFNYRQNELEESSGNGLDKKNSGPKKGNNDE